MSKEYLVNVTVDTIELFVYAKNKEEAKKKAIKEIQEDPNYFHEIIMWVNDEDVQQSDDFDGTIDDILGGLDKWKKKN